MDKAKRLARWREAQGISLTQLAVALGYDVSYLSRIEANERPITDGFMWRFTEVYGHDTTLAVFNGKTAGIEQ